MSSAETTAIASTSTSVEVIDLDAIPLRSFQKQWSPRLLRERDDASECMKEFLEATLGVSGELVYPEDVSEVPFYHWDDKNSTTDDSGFPIGALYDDDDDSNETATESTVDGKVLFKGFRLPVNWCSICLNYIYRDEKPDKACTLAQQCGHAFHRCCIVRCLRNRNDCPECREVVSNIQPYRNNLPENLIVRQPPFEHRFRQLYSFVTSNFIYCNVFQIKSFNINKIRCLVSDTQYLALSLDKEAPDSFTKGCIPARAPRTNIHSFKVMTT